MTDIKPRVLVFGGCGFIGREIVEQLVSGGIAEEVLIVDKVPPQMAWLGAKHDKTFKKDCVTFKSANLINSSSIDKVYNEHYDWVINAAGETKLGLSKELYGDGITKLSLNCARAAAKNKAEIYIEISDGRLGPTGKNGHRETDTPKPWCDMATCKIEVEKALKGIDGLKWAVIRPAVVYGSGDRNGVVGMLVMGAVYRQLGEKMRLLWDSSLKVNTVHVRDLARAVIFLCDRPDSVGEIFNLVDEADSSLGSISEIVAEIFQIKKDFYGTAQSLLAKIDSEGTISEINEKHLPPWAEVCSAGAVHNTPLTPYLDRDVLKGADLRLFGGKIQERGFKCENPAPTREGFIEVLRDAVDQKMFPKNALPKGLLDS